MEWTGWMVLQYTVDYTWGIVQSHLLGMNQVWPLEICYHGVADNDSQDTVADGVAFLHRLGSSSCL
jgi:hypothetical protein